MAKRPRIRFTVELHTLEVDIPNQDACSKFVRTMNKALAKAWKAANNVPTEAELPVPQFSGELLGYGESADAQAMTFDEFGPNSSDVEDEEEAPDKDTPTIPGGTEEHEETETQSETNDETDEEEVSKTEALMGHLAQANKPKMKIPNKKPKTEEE